MTQGREKGRFGIIQPESRRPGRAFRHSRVSSEPQQSPAARIGPCLPCGNEPSRNGAGACSPSYGDVLGLGVELEGATVLGEELPELTEGQQTIRHGRFTPDTL